MTLHEFSRSKGGKESYNRPDLQRDYDIDYPICGSHIRSPVTTDLIYKGIMTSLFLLEFPFNPVVTTDLIYKGIMTHNYLLQVQVHSGGGYNRPDLQRDYDQDCAIVYILLLVLCYNRPDLQRDYDVEQLNVYAHLLRRQGYPVEKLTINCVYKDWRPSAGRYKEDYPEFPVMEFNFEPWPDDTAKQFYEERLHAHVEALGIDDSLLGDCESTYMWEKPSVFAVFRPGSSRAIRLLSTKRDAEQYIKYKSLTGCQIEHRVGVTTDLIYKGIMTKRR